jgi:hypothetical protein
MAAPVLLPSPPPVAFKQAFASSPPSVPSSPLSRSVWPEQDTAPTDRISPRLSSPTPQQQQRWAIQTEREVYLGLLGAPDHDKATGTS